MSATGCCEPAAGNARVSGHWEQQFASIRADASCWINNQLISERVSRMISGGASSAHWLQWVLGDYLRGHPGFARSLSVCCGDGSHELILHRSGKVRFVQGFDISEGAVRQAREKFLAAGANPDTFLFEVRDANDLRLDGRFDLLLSSGALHHVTELEDLLDKLHALLLPEGYFVLLEYVGPNRFQWTERQCEVINGALAQLDPHYLKGGRRTELRPPPITELMAVDPSEAVRSEDVMPLVRERFRVEYEARFNGTLLHMLYPLLNAGLGNRGARDFDSIVRLLIYFEDVLVGSGVLPTDFAFAVCRRKGPGDARPASLSTPAEPAGHIDSCSAEEVTGWAADLARPSRTLFVDVRVGGERVGRIFCDGYRGDVRAAGYGNGLCGFALRFPPGKRPAAGSRVEVFVSGTEQLVAAAVAA